MRHTHHNKNLAPPPNDDRYEMAGRIWDSRIGSVVAQNASWRLFSFICLALLSFSLIGMAWLGAQPRLVPHIVEVVDGDKVSYIGQVDEKKWTITRANKLKSLHEWIKYFRSLSSDRNVLVDRQAKLRMRSTAAANLRLDALLLKEDPFIQIDKKTRTISIESTTQLPKSPDAFRVEWVEREFGLDGSKGEVTRWVGDFYLVTQIPETIEQMKSNHLGIFVNFFDINKKQISK